MHKRLTADGETHVAILPFYGVLDGQSVPSSLRGMALLDSTIRGTEGAFRPPHKYRGWRMLPRPFPSFIKRVYSTAIFAGSSIDGSPFLTVYVSVFYEAMTRSRPPEGVDDCTIESSFRESQMWSFHLWVLLYLDVGRSAIILEKRCAGLLKVILAPSDMWLVIS